MAGYARLLPFLLLFALRLLASLSPPDSGFTGGLYDDGDHDDVIVVITESVALPTSVAPATSSAFLVPAGRILISEHLITHAVYPDGHRPRAPPSASSL